MPGRNQTALQIAYLFPRRYAPGYAPSGDDCLPWFQQDRYQAFVEARQVSLRKRRPGQDPSHGGTAGQKRANSQIRRQRELQEWKASNGDQPADPAVFEREILPLLQNMPPSLIVRATG